MRSVSSQDYSFTLTALSLFPPTHAMTAAAAAVALFTMLAASCQLQPASGLSFWDSQFSTSEFAQYRYKDQFMVTIFQHINKNSTFYITPLVLLDHKSGSLKYSAFTNFWELRFKVIMWDAELQESVATYLRTVRGVPRPDVKLLPMEKVRFDWRSRSRPLRKDVVMEGEFMATHHLPRLLTLTFACRNESQCELLRTMVRADPESMDSLVLDCFMTAQKSASKTITVNTENLMQSTTFSKLLLLPPDGNYRYMRADDFNNLVQETFSSVRANTIRSSEYVDKFDELNIMKLIEQSLKQDEVFSSTLAESKWSSVFWDPTFARPDRVVREATKTFLKDDATGKMKVNKEHLRISEDARRLFTSGSSSNSIYGSVSAWFGSGSVGTSGSSSPESRDDRSSRTEARDSFTTDELNTRLREANLNVEWEGERFIVSPMRLVRINQQSYRSKRQLVSSNMQLTIYQQTISLKVIVKAQHNESSLMKETPAAASFPSQHSYCLLSNGGACPPGFTRSSGFMKALNLDTGTAGMIKSAKLGDSAIRCHSPRGDDCSFTGWDPYKGELHLHVCCR